MRTLTLRQAQSSARTHTFIIAAAKTQGDFKLVWGHVCEYCVGVDFRDRLCVGVCFYLCVRFIFHLLLLRVLFKIIKRYITTKTAIILILTKLFSPVASKPKKNLGPALSLNPYHAL